MWNKDALVSLARTKTAAVVAASALSALAGATAATLISARKFEAKYREMAETEIAEAKKFYATVNKTDIEPEDLTVDYESSTTVVEVVEGADLVKQEEIIRTMKYHSPSEDPEDVNVVDEELVEKAVEEVLAAQFDLAREMENRVPEVPYVISHDEFMENIHEFEQAQLTYFEGDDVLIDSADQMLPPDMSVIGGPSNLSFGFGSLDPNIVYIRNEGIEIEFCVVRSMGSYAEEVLGFVDDDLKHSGRPQIRKFSDRRADG
jgi:hypothetical protein